MNTVNVSTKFFGFQLHLECSPRLILALSMQTVSEIPQVVDFICRLHDDVAEAKENLLLAKITQAHHQSKGCTPEPDFKINDFVMLSTKNQRREFTKKGEKCTTKFFPWWDGPYCISDCHPSASTYTLDIKTYPDPVFYTSELKAWYVNDDSLFPGCTQSQPGPIVTSDGLQEFLIQDIVDSHKCGCSWQFLV
jgi:hypothetical protein